MTPVTTQIDSYVKSLIRSLNMLWTVKLNNGTVIYSDYERETDSPFDRMCKYCTENNLYPVEVKSLMFGAPETVMFSDPNGLDGFFILRGAVKDVDLNSADNSISYKKLVVGLLREDKIEVRKFCWPENEIDSNQETRLLTPDNIRMMYFKNQARKAELLNSVLV
jgi:hypothetical protein